ncbi:uncharacterized protein Dmoj_GI16937, isoform G [Drosophila mojavensis]|uniref:Uncharacterized protein, isoform B n=1 Tax=Drosophila mojavensis TaxID=7230 RepID=A0A0Q9X2M6_DROMO|nr:uncharacterized protein Dmoj_GI16937, isoform B [Drosophila mojavensis]KRG02306.1 uncharacterized protein Dmoj_GI16937, isoform E [Drosophila mojavensis]KRG02307.1 uncharacterized protein Dmoj_GI16937, isoform F [Drosophila mojavensis]KRG02308.1 uncharacterized protein Dmoj_GI16937, isoform G [Drosophila mojavensis]
MTVFRVANWTLTIISALIQSLLLHDNQSINQYVYSNSYSNCSQSILLSSCFSRTVSWAASIVSQYGSSYIFYQALPYIRYFWQYIEYSVAVWAWTQLCSIIFNLTCGTLLLIAASILLYAMKDHCGSATANYFYIAGVFGLLAGVCHICNGIMCLFFIPLFELKLAK